MIFRRNIVDYSICPGCGVTTTFKQRGKNESVDCIRCGMTYFHQATEQTQFTSLLFRPLLITSNKRGQEVEGPIPCLPQPGSVPLKRKRECYDDEEMRLFRRVRILNDTRKGVDDGRKYDPDIADNLVVGTEVACFLSHKGFVHCMIVAIIYDRNEKLYDILLTSF